MYTFKIVKAKYSRKKRIFFGMTLLLYAIVGHSFLIIPVVESLKRNIHNQTILYIVGPLVMFFPLILFFIINSRVLGKIYLIGNISIDEKKIKIQTKNLDKEISLKDINLLKFKAGTGNGGKSATVYATYICSITLRDKTFINIHLTRQPYVDNIRQKTAFGQNLDLFRLLELYRIRFEFDRHLKENSCIE